MRRPHPAVAVIELLEAEGYIETVRTTSGRLEHMLRELLDEELEAAHRRGVLEALGAEVELPRYIPQ